MVIVMICCVTEGVIFQFQVVTIDDAHCFLSHLVLGLFFKLQLTERHVKIYSLSCT